MRGITGLLVVMVMVIGAPVVSAEVSYSETGRIVQVGGYTGPGFEVEDAAYLGVVVGGTAVMGVWDWPIGKAPSLAMMSVGLVTYGAWRTAQYRPQEVKDRVHAAILARKDAPKPGTVQELLGM